MIENLDSDLSTEATREFFRARDPALEKAVMGMESVESWTLDRVQSVQETLQKFADSVEHLELDSLPTDLHNKLIILLGYISSGKAIKLLMWIESSSPNFVAKTIAEAQMLSVIDKLNVNAAKLFVERFEVLERLHMLSRIFSGERLEVLQKVMRILAGEDVSEEGDDPGEEGEDQYARS
jgi:hypothetical protein